MPADGTKWLPKEALMAAEEIRRIVSLGIERLGVRVLRITGGEPLIRPDLVDRRGAGLPARGCFYSN